MDGCREVLYLCFNIVVFILIKLKWAQGGEGYRQRQMDDGGGEVLSLLLMLYGIILNLMGV